MSITKEQWADIETRLSTPFGRVEFKADGYALVAAVRGMGGLKQAVVVYVDGVMKGEWVKGGCPEADKFCRPQRRWVWKTKARDMAKAILKKRKLDPALRDHYTSVATAQLTTWLPYWTSPAAFCRHLRKTCAEIDLVGWGFDL